MNQASQKNGSSNSAVLKMIKNPIYVDLVPTQYQYAKTSQYNPDHPASIRT